MCGISCILALQHNHPHKPTSDPCHVSNGHIEGVTLTGNPIHDSIAHELDASLEQIKHRGPDSRGQWISPDGRVAFGHVRLAINDLSSDGVQPFHSVSNSIHAVVNGEFYDYDAIRAHLEAVHPQYTFRSRSDSELIIALYQYHGLDFVHHLRGEFAAVLFDEERQLFVAVRDRWGIKPLFWTVQEGRLLVAAEIKAFLPLGWKKREWDVRSLIDGGWGNDERTIFKNIHKIRPGHYLTCQSFGHIEQRQYWDISYPSKHALDPRTPEELIEGVRSRLLESIRIRLRADVPIGIYLSGGIDSSVIAGMTAHLLRSEPSLTMGSAPSASRITCFSIAFDETSGFDESLIANRTAEWLGVRYIKKHMNEAELAKRFEDATWHAEHPNPDLNYVGKFALSEVPQEHGFKVVLTGEGADENFAGYPVYLPDFLREPDHSWEHNSLPAAHRKAEFHKAEHAAKRYYESVGADGGNRDPTTASHMLNHISTPASMSAFQLDMFAPWTHCYGLCDPRETIANNVDGVVRKQMKEHWHPLHAAEYVWSKGHLANLFLTCLGDRGEMAHSIEARTPFLDHKFTEYVSNLPPSAKLHWQSEDGTDGKKGRFVEKWVLREAAKPFITRELYERKKHPYSAPTTWPRDGPLHELFFNLITKENVQKLGFVDWDRCKKLVDKAFGDVEDEELEANGETNGEANGGTNGLERRAKELAKKAMAMRYCITIAQWIVIGQRFGLRTASAPEGM